MKWVLERLKAVLELFHDGPVDEVSSCTKALRNTLFEKESIVLEKIDI